jgi:MMP 1-O-methyltransferase
VSAIEPHERFTGMMGSEFGPADRSAFFRNLLAAGVEEKVRLVNLSSEVVAPNWRLPVALLWIDGDHRDAAVRRDFACWEPHLRGPVAFHDARPGLGPGRLVEELVADGRYRVVERVKATAVLRGIATLP